MIRIISSVLAGALAFAGIVYVVNASWLVRGPAGAPYFISHRGVHQTFDHARIAGPQDCTAVLIHPPEHGFIENTLPSMQAAFDAGAEIVELDIHPTTDGEFAVFHDWTLDCRTDGGGVTRQRSMDYIRMLDAGYGYTADGGRTYPLRGSGVGMIPTLGEVLDAFPDRRLLLNFKSDDPREADLLSDYLEARGADLSTLMVYGGDRPTMRFLELHPGVRGYSRETVKSCLLAYMAVGWSGLTPAACRDSIVVVPRNYAWLVWGWPRRFEQRMERAGSDVWILGDIDTPEDLQALPDDFAGGVRTNRIEEIGPR